LNHETKPYVFHFIRPDFLRLHVNIDNSPATYGGNATADQYSLRTGDRHGRAHCYTDDHQHADGNLNRDTFPV